VTAVEEDLRDCVTPRQGVALDGDAPCDTISARARVCVCVCVCVYVCVCVCVCLRG
jgi:hypothetical protein